MLKFIADDIAKSSIKPFITMLKKKKKAYRKHVAKPIKKQRQHERRYKGNQTNHSITGHLPPMCGNDSRLEN